MIEPGETPTAFVVDDEPAIGQLVALWLKTRGVRARLFEDADTALAALDREAPNLIVCDVSMPGTDGLELLARVRSSPADCAIVIMTAFGSEDIAVQALRRGADDYLQKPLRREVVDAVVQRTLERQRLARQNATLRAALDRQREQLLDEVARAARVQADLLPGHTPAWPGYSIAGRCIPARSVGGDFFDWLETPRGTRVCLLGDVMGKGLAAALLMATVRAALRVALHEAGPAAALYAVSDALRHDFARAEAYVTLFVAELDPVAQTLACVDAGHGLAFVRRGDGSTRQPAARGLPMGILAGEHWTEERLEIAPGDALVVYSDGLLDPEADIDPVAPAGRLDGLRDAAALCDRLAPPATPPGEDDITVLVLARDA